MTFYTIFVDWQEILGQILMLFVGFVLGITYSANYFIKIKEKILKRYGKTVKDINCIEEYFD